MVVKGRRNGRCGTSGCLIFKHRTTPLLNIYITFFCFPISRIPSRSHRCLWLGNEIVSLKLPPFFTSALLSPLFSLALFSRICLFSRVSRTFSFSSTSFVQCSMLSFCYPRNILPSTSKWSEFYAVAHNCFIITISVSRVFPVNLEERRFVNSEVLKLFVESNHLFLWYEDM